MNNFKIEEKEAFRLVCFKTKLKSSEKNDLKQFSDQKTEFFKSIVQSGKMSLLRTISESNYGYAAVTTDGSNTFYYAGVKSSQPVVDESEEVLFPEGKYLVIEGKGGLSRLAFDELEEQAFKEILTEKYSYEYSGNPIAEILLNGNPADCEVEVWIPVKQK
ncbi:GyrI-like domain-containing protein [Clostridium sp. BL-8]|uniref:GyrI-like domain-containing protein n=1 Tax=Clostridium sp. BL-8 TaxID=349938 RepID=UPI00098CA3EF|nr:GyrI-like domain-containing protein [Clostridium sp. BL-8]OOM72954.1 bacterial transcription activator, effector binding domain [Clostridium sp. BL-8]